MRSRINLRLKRRIQELKQAGMPTSIATKVAKSEDKTDQKPKKAPALQQTCNTSIVDERSFSCEYPVESN
jgi:hypothetical protein